MAEDTKFRRYFVDEAGDLSFFNKKGRIIVGQPGVSKFFMVGVAQISDPEAVTGELNALRAKLMTHPRYKGIPSMQPEAKKTAIAFHAKDDYAEIREQVFELIQSFDVKVFVAIRSKAEIAEPAKANFKSFRQDMLQQNALYCTDLIGNGSSKICCIIADVVQIAIARRRQRSPRRWLWKQAINQAQRKF